MKINADFIKSRMGDKWVAVATGNAEDGFSGIIELNQTACDIWDMIDKGLTESEIAFKIAKDCGEDEKRVLADVNKTVKTFILYGIIESEKGYPERCIAHSGKYYSTAHGNSMFPLINSGDEVCVIPLDGEPKKYDIVLYRRGNKLVLHRVVRLLKDGRYVLRGDNNFYTEISDGGNFIGILFEYKHGEKRRELKGFKYKFYSFIRVHTFALRRVFAKLFNKKVKGD